MVAGSRDLTFLPRQGSIMDEQFSNSFPVLPLRDIVVFPHMIVPLFVGREKSVRALEEVMQDDKQILLSSQVDPSVDEPDQDGIFRVGVLANVLQLLKLPDGTVKVLVEGKSRVRITEFVENPSFFEAMAEPLFEEQGDVSTIEALTRSVAEEFERYAKVKKNIPEEALAQVSETREPAKLADLVAGHLGVEVDQKQKLLETLPVSERLEQVFGLMQGEMSVMQVEKKIKTRVKSQMEKTQREYYLNEQMKAIQKELGDGEDGSNEVAELEEKIAETKLSKEAREKAEGELKKLRNMSPMSAEATVVRNYLDWILSLPWGTKSRVKKDLGRAQDILDAEDLRVWLFLRYDGELVDVSEVTKRGPRKLRSAERVKVLFRILEEYGHLKKVEGTVSINGRKSRKALALVRG